MSSNDTPRYVGCTDVHDQSGRPFPYLASPALIEAVNLAIFLERPLLIKGEPGCGKTMLARHVALELELDYFFWSVKSTSRARDGLYTYDAVRRLREAQLAAANRIPAAELAHLDDDDRYVRLGPLGRAFRTPRRSVVLLDEIDKADIDFPNDLLHELESKEFTIEETGERVQALAPPLVFITSNDEKELPDALLRRCVFFYIDFPDAAALQEILHAHFASEDQALVQRAVTRFIELRDRQRDKKASTSELIDWFRVLRRYPEDEALRQLDGRLPYLSVLIKSINDHLDHLRQGDQ